MEYLTLIVAIVVGVMILRVKPLHGLILYFSVIALYPSYLTVSVGTVDFTASRIIVMVFFAKLLFFSNLYSYFKFNWVDKILLVYFFSETLAGIVTNESVMALVENRAGKFFDLILPYFAIRITIKNKEDYLLLLKGLMILSIPLAIAGFYQCMTGKNLVGFFKQYYSWRLLQGTPLENIYGIRFGFVRADVIFEHPIVYGMFFAILGPICAGVIPYEKKYKIFWSVSLVFMGVGVFSSMSSGPFLAALSALAFLVFFRWKTYWRPVVISLVFMCLLVEIASPLHFYDVLGRYTLNPGTAWYRRRLIDVALFEGGMSGHWIFGYGYDVDPNWGPRIDGREYTDIVNHYIMLLCQYGLVGFIPFAVMIVSLVKGLIEAYRKDISRACRWLIWCLLASIYGVSLTCMSVALIGVPGTLYYVMIGLCSTMPIIVKKVNTQGLVYKQDLNH